MSRSRLKQFVGYGQNPFLRMVVVGSMATAVLLGQAGVLRSAQPDEAVVVFSIPVGDQGIAYEGGTPERPERWGPSALRIGADGSFLVLDSARSSIVRVSPDGQRQDVIRVEGAESIFDVAFDGAEFFALDIAAALPKVHRLRPDGTPVSTLELSQDVREMGLTGIVTEAGETLLELHGGAQTATFGGVSRAERELTSGRYRTRQGGQTDRASSPRTVLERNGQPLRIDVANILGAASVVGEGVNGEFFVLVEELADSTIVEVDQTVRRYNANGSLVALARVPIDERVTYVPHGVAVGPTGDVFAMITRSDRVDVVRLAFSERLEPVLKPRSATRIATADSESAGPAMTVAATTCRSRNSMIAVADAYVKNRKDLTVANIDGKCTGRTKPRRLPAMFDSVAYDWGGTDTPSSFNAAMDAGFQAGDIDKTSESCSRGVDCSAFVSNAWAATRQTTESLPTISTVITKSELQPGDILNKSGTHVAMFVSNGTNGPVTVEATTDMSYDRVAYITNPSWTRFSTGTGYSYRRYNSVCPDTTGSSSARPVASGSLALTLGPYVAGQTISGSFTVTNRGNASVTMTRLLIGGRLGGAVVDFPSASNVTLAAGQSYRYSGNRVIDQSGKYDFFIAFQKADGTWVTSVERDSGVVTSALITALPRLTGFSPSTVRVKSTSQDIYLKGAGLANTAYISVQPPTGPVSYLYPTSQIFTKSGTQVGIRVTWKVKGTYYVRVYDASVGWSNSLTLKVN